MSDEADVASEEETLFRELQLRRARANRSRMTARVLSRESCTNCGDPIPEARRKAVPGAERCTDCQFDLERRGA